ncbi:MAG: CBM9 family sugar-binding protein [Pseudomonadota bacterium]
MKTTTFLFALAIAMPLAHAERVATFTDEPPVIDGVPDDSAWAAAPWYALDFSILGAVPTTDDFSARYRVTWDAHYLYLLAEITDDVLVDAHASPYESYWNDDTLEIFVDEDASGGIHQFNHSAFAYHIGLDNQVVDIGPFRTEAERARGEPIVVRLPSHVTARWQRSATPPYPLYWEVKLRLHRFTDDAAPLEPVTLRAGKEIGFMVAYCDADDANGRQHFMGDVEIEAVNGDRNLGYIDADVFGRLTLRQAAPKGESSDQRRERP